MNKNAICLGLIGLLAAAAAAEEKQTVSQSEKEFTGGEIIVTADRIKPVETAATTRELTAEDLERLGAGNVTEALRTMPGIYTRVGNDGVERVDIRGFRTRHVILLLNGVPLNSTFDGQFDAALIPVENISKIKVSYGNQSVLYGNGGLGGVINVITKRGEPGTHGSAEAQVGEGDRYIARGTLSQSSEKVDVFVGASHAQQDHYNLSDDFEPTAQEDGGERENSDYKRNNVLASATLHLEDDWAIGIVANYMQGDYGKPHSVYPQDTFASRTKYLRVDDYEGCSGQITLNRNKEDELSVRSALFFNTLHEEENNYDNATYSTISRQRSYTQDSDTTVCGGNLQLGRKVWKGAHATVGGMLRCEKYEEERVEFTNNSGAFDATSLDRQLLNGSVAAELEQAVGADWILIGGVSGNWQENDDGDSDTAPSWMLGTTYDLFDATVLHASYARQIRFPSIKQLYETDGGNVELKKEASDNYEAGITQMLGERNKLDVTGFVRDVDDFIEKDTTGVNRNFEKYFIYGVETALDSQLTDSLTGYASYTYMKTENISTDYPLQYRPEHVVQLGAEWTVFKHLLLFGKVRYVADQYYYSRTAPVQQAELNDYVLLDLRATVVLKDMVDLYVGVDNVLDENYEQSYGVPREGRMFYAGIKAAF